ncbi:MAG: hypothetical protein QM734_14005 [Cyclobacteriaceae bacterium]
MKRNLLIGLFTIHFCAVFGQRVVTGRLVDKATGKPVKQGIVTLKGTNIRTNPNVMGFFQLKVDSISRILVESENYENVEVEVPQASNFRIELSPIVSSSRSAGDERIFLDKFGFVCDPLQAESYRIVTFNNLTGFSVKEFYMTDKPKLDATFLDSELYTGDGNFILYYPNGQKEKEGSYADGKAVGRWTAWYRNGKLKEEGHYTEKLVGEPKYIIDSFLDSLGNVLTTNGQGEYISEEDFPYSFSKGQIKESRKEGTWKGYLSNGTLAFEEEYHENRLINGVSYDSLRKSINTVLLGTWKISIKRLVATLGTLPMQEEMGFKEKSSLTWYLHLKERF